MLQWLKAEKGFTFLEMTIVIAIIGFLMMIGLPNYKSAAVKAQEKSCEANRMLIESQIESYYIDEHKYPAGDDTIQELITKKYLKSEPKCPSGGTYNITFPTGLGSLEVSCTEHPTTTTPTTPE